MSPIRMSLAITITALGLAPLAACSSTVDPFDDDDGATCSGYEDATATTDVTVTVRNAGAEAIYLTGLGCESDVDLRLYDAEDNALRHQQAACHFTCADLQTHNGVCAADCAVPPVVMIAPGGSYELAWSGTFHQVEQMPATCYFDDASFAQESCDQRIVAPAGDYQFEITAYDDSGCQPEPTGCTCVPDDSGSCTVDGFTEISGDGRTARAQLSFPSETAAEIVFD